MFEKDYILRLLHQFFDDISLFLGKRKKDNEENDWATLYGMYLGDYSFFRTAGMDEIMHSFDKYNATEKLYRMEMLAELYFQEARLETDATRKHSLFKRSLRVWEYINRNSDTYSIERIQRIEFIKNML